MARKGSGSPGLSWSWAATAILASATSGPGWPAQQLAQAYAVSTRTLERLRQRAHEAGVEAVLLGQPRQQWPASTRPRQRPTG